MADYNSSYTGAQIDTAIGKANAAIPSTEKGASNGVATLDNLGKVPSTQLPEMSAGGGVKLVRYVIGTSTAGWTSADCDYLCDGTADDVEINAAIQALPATGGEIVILDGTYNITAPIAISKSNITLRGNGSNTVLSRGWESTGSPTGVVNLTSVNNCCIEKLRVEGNKATYSVYYNCAICLNGSSNNIIKSNICNNNGIGIKLYNGSSYNTVNGNICNNNSYNGISTQTGSNNYNAITGNICNANSDSGIHLFGGEGNAISGNTANNGKVGINLLMQSNSSITGNTCNNNTHYGIKLDGQYSTPNNNNTIVGNICYNSGYTGIYLLSENSRNNVTGNVYLRGTGLAGDYSASQYTINVSGSGNANNLITNNVIMGKDVANNGTGTTLANNKHS